MLGTFVNYTVFMPLVFEALQEVQLEMKYEQCYKDATVLKHKLQKQATESGELLTVPASSGLIPKDSWNSGASIKEPPLEDYASHKRNAGEGRHRIGDSMVFREDMYSLLFIASLKPQYKRDCED